MGLFFGRGYPRLLGIVLFLHGAPFLLRGKPCTHVRNAPCGCFSAKLYGGGEGAIFHIPPKRSRAERQGVAWCFGGLNKASKANHAAIGQCVENCNGSAGGVAIQSHRSGRSKKPTGGVLKNQKAAGARRLFVVLHKYLWLNRCTLTKVHGGDFLLPAQSPCRFPRSVGALSFWRLVVHADS